ncbi:MAG: RNA polymerase-binding protein DksA [Limnohabitans sp.]|nr:RNA polymerase-binding protein DksA [Limnohabitans sp.]
MSKKPAHAKKLTPAKKATPAKSTPAKKVVAAKKPVAPKKVEVKKATPAKSTPAKKVVAAKKPVAPKKVEVKKVEAKKPEVKKTEPTKKTESTVKQVVGSTDVKATAIAKKSPRAAKAMSMMPPPPGQLVASTTAKASYGPIVVPTILNVVPVIHKKDPQLANNWKSKSVDQLTDAEVLAMPDSEYMNETQLAFFRLKLVQLKNDILANAGETTEHLREDTVVVPDPADRATIEEEHALELRTRDRERKLLKKIQQSIALIDAGEYGYCDETGEPIGVGRLIARPTATLSLEAQQRRELKQKMFGD